MTQRIRRMSCIEFTNCSVSLLLYLAQVAWLIYGNYIYFNLDAKNYMSQADDSEATTSPSVQAADGTTESSGGLSQQEINSEKWLYVALLTVLTIGYIQLMIFAAIILVIVYSAIASCWHGLFSRSDDENASSRSRISPYKVWQFIDEGIFSLLDELDEQELVDYNYDQEPRDEVERRLALEKLDEKPFETVRLDTIDQIREGLVKGSLHSFRSPTSNCSQQSPDHRMRGRFNFDVDSSRATTLNQSVFDLAGRNTDKSDTTETANPQTGTSYTDEIIDYARMRNPETYFQPPQQPVLFTNVDNDDENRITGFECAICQERFERTSMVCQMPCHIKHIFHADCIKPWIKKQNACPLCK